MTPSTIDAKCDAIQTHTPGPWSIFDLHDATRINVRGPCEEFVADCGDGFYSDETDDWVMAEESLPNARLIAAAPDLLKACADWIGWMDSDLDHPKAADHEEAMLSAMRVAVAKARGQ